MKRTTTSTEELLRQTTSPWLEVEGIVGCLPLAGKCTSIRRIGITCLLRDETNFHVNAMKNTSVDVTNQQETGNPLDTRAATKNHFKHSIALS
jgi:hypothetical protein